MTELKFPTSSPVEGDFSYLNANKHTFLVHSNYGLRVIPDLFDS